MFTKRAECKTSDLKMLHVPKHEALDLFIEHDLFVDQQALSEIKIASTKESFVTQGDDKKFDLEAEIKEFPDSLFTKCFAIKADETNDNGDYFSKEELKKAVSTFIGVPVFTNHQNNDINQARGKVIHSWWDEDRNGIMVIMRIDASAYPQLARGITQKIIIGTSMGCSVKYSLCSVCHNYAETPDGYCSCVKNRKTRKISQKKVKCSYHKNGTEKECPLCGSTEERIKTFDVEDQQVFEYNYGIKFIENSAVCNPACHDCGITEVIDVRNFLSKVADIEERLPALLKAAKQPAMCTDHGCIGAITDQQEGTLLQSLQLLKDTSNEISKAAGLEILRDSTKRLIKNSGQKEIDDLNKALDLLTSVSQAMLMQKDQIDLEFLSDLVEVLSNLQTVTDELTEQGYGRLQSPQQTGATPPGTATTETTPPTGAPPAGQTATPAATPAPKVQTGPAGVGTVTGPMAKRKLDLEKWANDLIHKNTRKHLDFPFLSKKRKFW